MAGPITSEADTGTMSGKPEGTLNIWTWLALLVSLVALGGSLALSLAMGLKACPLCFYQRTFVMGVVGVLLIGLLAGARDSRLLGLLALPAAVGGLGVAAFHVYLEATGKLECPPGLNNIGSAPQQSLAALAILFVVLALSIAQGQGRTNAPLGFVAAVVLGGGFAYGAIVSAPPAPPAPTKAYDPEKQPLDMCRPPYRPS
jgi:disulfide bond formation protein DsbB